MYFHFGFTSFGSCKNHLTSVNRKESVQQNPKAQSFFCEVFGEDLNEGKRHLRAKETNAHTHTHKCHLIAISYKSMAVRTVLAYELSSKNEPTTMQREDGLDRSRMINIPATYGSVCHHCMPRPRTKFNDTHVH